VLATAVAGPLATCLVLVPFRGHVDVTKAALVLVLVVVAVAATGHRVAGAVAAVSAGIWFDFFLTEPYQRFAIRDRADLETVGLLLLVGLGVSQLAVWGRGQQARASRDEGYLAGIFAVGAAAGADTSPSELIDRVCSQLTLVLELSRCRFDYGTGLGHPRLTRDRTVVWNREALAADGGLPTDRETELLVQSGGAFRGRFLLTPTSRTRPSPSQLGVALALADEVGAALAFRHDLRHS
jgi:K+-sensing histidine kinase KdpD